MKIGIQRAGLQDVRDIAVMTGEYQAEMLAQAGFGGADFRRQEREALLREFLENADYAVLVARSVRGHPLGYLTIFESRPYFDDPHGLVEQIYVRPFYRRRRIARRLILEARDLGEKKRWRRLMVMFPASRRLDAALALFQKQGFMEPGGRKQWLRI